MASKPTHARRIRLRPIARQAAPVAPGIDPAVHALLAPAQAVRQPRVHANERGDAWFFFPDRRVGVVRDGRVAELDRPVALDAHAALAPDGIRLLVIYEDGSRLVVELFDVATGGSTRVARIDTQQRFRFVRRPAAVAFVPGGFVVLAGGVLMAFAGFAEDGEPSACEEIDDGGYTLATALQGRLLITEGKRSSTLLWTVRDGALELLYKGAFEPPQYVYAGSGRVAFDFGLRDVRELHGLAAACGWSPDDLPPVREATAVSSAPLAVVARWEREIARAAAPELPDAFLVHPLSGGRVLVFREGDDAFSVSLVDGAREVAGGAIPFTHAAGPVYAVAPDETDAVCMTRTTGPTQLFHFDLRTGAWAPLCTVDRDVIKVAHLGDALVLSTRRTAQLLTLADLQAKPVELGEANDLVAFCGGKVLLACASTGTSDPPSTTVFVRRGQLERVGELALAVRSGWTAHGRRFVTCWHGNRAYELPNLDHLA